MILNFLKEISLETLRKNIEINLENYKTTTNDWIFKFFDDNSPFLEFKKEVPQFNIIHEGKGRGNAYTMGVYRYTTIDKFLKAKSTADL